MKLGEVGSGGSKLSAVKKLYEYKYEISYSIKAENLDIVDLTYMMNKLNH